MTTVKEFFEMTKFICDIYVDIDIYPDAQNQKHFESLAYNYNGEQRFFSEVLEKYATRSIAYIEVCFEDDYNTICYNLILKPD